MVDCQGALQQRERERERKLPELVIISFVRVIFARQMHRHLWEIFHIAGAENIFWIAPKIKIIFEMGGGGGVRYLTLSSIYYSALWSIAFHLLSRKKSFHCLRSNLLWGLGFWSRDICCKTFFDVTEKTAKNTTLPIWGPERIWNLSN